MERKFQKIVECQEMALSRAFNALYQSVLNLSERMLCINFQNYILRNTHTYVIVHAYYEGICIAFRIVKKTLVFLLSNCPQLLKSML